MLTEWVVTFLNGFKYTIVNWDVWNGCTLTLFIICCILFVMYVSRFFGRKNVVGNNSLIWTVLINVSLYVMPVIYVKFQCNSPKSFLWMLIEQVGHIVKMFVGEAAVESEIYTFAAACPLFVYAFALGIIDALLVSYFAAASALSDKIANSRRLNKKTKPSILEIFSGIIKKTDIKCCDIIIGCDDESLEYAMKNDAVILKESSDDVASFNELIANGYTVLNRDFTVAFLKNSFFKRNQRYNFIFLGESRKSVKLLNIFINYLNEEKIKKNIYLYTQVPEDGIEIVQNHIAQLYKNDERIHRITVFGRCELVAREFVEREPITKYMPLDYINENFYINSDKTVNVVMIGFTQLNRELLKQFIMNNQLATFKDGKYQLFGINYHIFAKEEEWKNWDGYGIDSELENLCKSRQYYEIPECPWNEKISYYSSIPAVSEVDDKIFKSIMKEDTYTYVIIDTGDIYLNMKLENKLSLLLAGKNKIKYHIYVRRGELFADNKPNVDCYGEYEKILEREVIIDEQLLKLAKMIAAQYNGEGTDSETEWKKSNYFNMYSNIYAANNLRLKLNLMGLDYEKKVSDDTSAEEKDFSTILNKVRPVIPPKQIKCKESGLLYNECKYPACDNCRASEKNNEAPSFVPAIECEKMGCEFYKEFHSSSEKTTSLDERLRNYLDKCYLAESPSNSVLAQEHYRWNAYHLMSGYLPKNKSGIKKYADRKDNLNKKHALLTTYNGIKDVASDLIIKGGHLCDVNFYENDRLIFDLIEKYMEENDLKLVERKHYK
ncbi:MAG: hypothetical protein E7411_08400 [Ruminococcaceae bacterium]|nr:hypothetical protein [Oscillospiraceae bacterium]